MRKFYARNTSRGAHKKGCPRQVPHSPPLKLTTVYDTLRNVLFFQQSASVVAETYFTLFSRQKCHAKFCTLARTFYNVHILAVVA